jgi:hypothetical protein
MKPPVQRTHHILSAASNLLGITLLIIAGLHISKTSANTFADEIAWGGAVCFSVSCLASYAALRDEKDSARLEAFADLVFMLGLGLLMISIIVLGLSQA